ncbi:hypothetical protein V6Z11_D05G432800 [Gossypium hirsutum]
MLDKSKYIRLGKAATSSGMGPSKEFSAILKCSSCVRFTIDNGTCPLNWFHDKSKYMSHKRFPNDLEIDPCKLELERDKYFKTCRLSIKSINFVKDIHDRSKCSRLLL